MKTFRHNRSDRERRGYRKRIEARKKWARGESNTLALIDKFIEGLKKVRARQQWQGSRGGKNNPEINVYLLGDPHHPILHIEQKTDESISLEEAFLQAVRDREAGAIPAAVVKRENQPEVIVLWLHDYGPQLAAWLREEFDG